MDISLYYQECGSGQPLVLLHGNGEDSSYFEHQIKYFSHAYRVIAIDTRGHGQSPRGTAPFSIAQFAEDLYHFFEEHQLEKANILGFSDGANIAMKFAMKYPEKVDKLILNGGNLNARGVKRSVQLPIEIGYRIVKFFAKKSKEEMLGLMVNDPNILPSELSKIEAKTLVICGKKDMIKESHTREIANHIPCASLSIISGDHFIANKNPEEFNVEVEKFLFHSDTASA